jgi:hypothetical protein
MRDVFILNEIWAQHLDLITFTLVQITKFCVGISFSVVCLFLILSSFRSLLIFAALVLEADERSRLNPYSDKAI